ncbi:MAG: hypothetical protein M3Y84_02260 [Acidobacteriota bacterium]|nr:hypothetical protein [Acidobacteriota bacterium]
MKLRGRRNVVVLRAMPSDVRKVYDLPITLISFSGCAPKWQTNEGLALGSLSIAGRSKAFRTSGGRASTARYE